MPTEVSGIPAILELLWKGGPLLAIMIFVYAGYKRIIVWGYQLEDQKLLLAEAKRECAEWKVLALENRQAAVKAVDMAHTIVRQQ
jgi:hypothetical protein